MVSLIIYLFLFIYFLTYFLGITWGWIQGLVLARQALYHLSYPPPEPFCVLVIFEIGYHVYTLADLEGDSPIYDSFIAGMPGAHHVQLKIFSPCDLIP
jgi:hypothetical protein